MADTPLVDLRGRMMPLSEASLKIYDGGIVLGATVTDLARTFRHEPFLSSTPYCLAPVTRINGVTIGAGRPGPVLDRLMKALDERMEMDIRGQIQTVDV